MNSKSNYLLRPLYKADLQMVLNWRNDERIRKYMYTNHIISFEEHLKWFENTQYDNSKIYRIFEANGIPVGLVNFLDIDYQKKTCVWGFYLGVESLPKGTGTIMGYYGLNFIFNEINLDKVYGEVLTNNLASIKFHEKLGFIRQKNTQHIYKNNTYFDIVKFGLSKSKWREHKVSLENILFN